MSPPSQYVLIHTNILQCDPAVVTQIFDTLSYDPLSATSFCTQVLNANVDLKLFAPRLPKNRSAGDITAACECIVGTSTTFASPAPPASTAASSFSAVQPAERVAEWEELRLREAAPAPVPAANVAGRWDPYGKGAEPVPIGSEFKGFGGKVPYMRGRIVEATRW
jgi:hypothetical protein